MITLYPGLRKFFFCFLIVYVISFFSACASVSVYTVDISYKPSKSAVAAAQLSRDIVFTVAALRDTRSIDDVSVIGSVIDSSGETSVITHNGEAPGKIVATVIRKYLSREGRSLSGTIAEWESESTPMDSGWGDVLIGGTIEELNVLCRKELFKKNYESKVKLTILFASVKNGRVFHKVHVETNPSLLHVSFSEKMLEEQISTALTDAIERVFGNPSLYTTIEEALR